MLLLPTEATVEEKNERLYGPKSSCAPLTTTNCLTKYLDSRVKTHHNRHRLWRRDTKVSNGMGSTGH